MESLWRKQTGKLKGKERREMEKADGNLCGNPGMDTHWDVIVIGAGMAGILIAYYLQEAGKRVLVLEAKTIASGQTEKTTAKITSQHDIKYSKLIKNLGLSKAKKYAKANEAAIREYEQLVKEKEIECDFERVPAYLYTNEKGKKLQEEAKAAALLGIHAHFTKETELPFEVEGAVCFENQAQFSPLKFVRSLAAQLEVREHTQVLDVKESQVITEKGILTADSIVMATHYPFRIVPGFYFLRQYQERSYVLAFSGCEKMKGMYYGVDKNGLSFRQAGDYLLIGGGAHRTGKKKVEGKYEFLRKAAKTCYPEGKEIAHWSAQDCMPHDGVPFIGKYSVFTPNLYVATGFQKWGMTTSMISAMILRDEICGKKNPYGEVFSPQRCYFRAGIGKFLIDLCMSVKGLAGGLFCGRKRRCTHMGCKLKWNPNEMTWDCPCHGSRFEENGTVLDNPAEKAIEEK